MRRTRPVPLPLLLATTGLAAAGCLGLGGRSGPPRNQLVLLREPVELVFEGATETVEVLPVVRAERPFHELLVSWNAATTENAGLRFEVRVGRGPDGWSPWLYVGDWNTARPPEARTTFENGRISVDYFTSDVYWERAQVRLTATFTPGAGNDAHARLDLLSLCFTDRWVLPDFDAPAPKARPAIAVPPKSQLQQDATIAARICSPTTLAMVLDYAGLDVSPTGIAARAYDATYDLYGNWPRSIQAAYSYGVPGYLARYDSWRPVARHLAAGRPVILSVAFEDGALSGAPVDATPGHLLVVLGFDEEGDVVVNDPAAPTDAEVRRVYRREELARAWLGHGGTAYVLEVAPPPSGPAGSPAAAPWPDPASASD